MSVWLVTGCSSGLGEGFVHEILARGDKVVATGRNAEVKLAHLKETGAAILDLDVTASQDILDSKIQEAIAIYGKIDILVNNAGFSFGGFVEDFEVKDWMFQLNTNFFGVVNVTKAILPHFRSRQSGKIAFSNSYYSFGADAGVGSYVVSKHALQGYAATLLKECAQFGIQTISFDLGQFRTEIISAHKVQFKTPEIADYRPMYEGFLGAVTTMSGFQPGDVKKGVSRMVDVLKGEGFAKGKQMPERMPIGPDSIELARAKCNAMLKICDEWESFVGSTDRDGPKEGAWATTAANEYIKKD